MENIAASMAATSEKILKSRGDNGGVFSDTLVDFNTISPSKLTLSFFKDFKSTPMHQCLGIRSLLKGP